MPDATSSESSPQFVPNGHFYSPVYDIGETLRRAPLIYSPLDEGEDGVGLCVEDQISVLEALVKHYRDDLFPAEATRGRRYYWRNPYFPFGDALGLDAFLHLTTPGRVVEVGSGFSSAVMLDAADALRAEGRPTPKLDFIDPYPERLHSLLEGRDERACTVWEREVQDVPMELFSDLQDGDLLFIDSSHVVKPGNDLWHLFFNVLPRLDVGVHVFIHDIPGRFEYPEVWIREGRSWNEAYLVRAFLQFNDSFAIRWMPGPTLGRFEAECRPKMPLVYESPGSGMWIQRLR